MGGSSENKRCHKGGYVGVRRSDTQEVVACVVGVRWKNNIFAIPGSNDVMAEQ